MGIMIFMCVLMVGIVIVSVNLGEMTEKAVRKYYGLDDEERDQGGDE